MKKFFASLILSTFLILSQLQLVHALDMTMDRHTYDTSTHSEGPIFCETTGEDHESNCAKELIPYKLTIEKNREDFIKKFVSLFSPIFHKESHVTHTGWDRGIPLDPGDDIFQKTHYVNLISIMKRLV